MLALSSASLAKSCPTVASAVGWPCTRLDATCASEDLSHGTLREELFRVTRYPSQPPLSQVCANKQQTDYVCVARRLSGCTAASAAIFPIWRRVISASELDPLFLSPLFLLMWSFELFALLLSCCLVVLLSCWLVLLSCCRYSCCCCTYR